ncbi:MAG TPA: biotin transporter BioY [Terriglobales bacterium]|nr:biotin transporter BioY [Terriglobales bacterium]
MQNSAVQAVKARTVSLPFQVLLVVGATLLMAILARFSMPLPFTPVVLTLSNLGVLFIGLALGSRRAAASMLLYLGAGAMGLPVFSNGGPGGVAQILGPTGGYLMAYPLAAFVAGWIAERGTHSVSRFAIAAVLGEMVLFAGGISWLIALGANFVQATNWGVYPFVFGEVSKIMVAVGASLHLHRSNKFQGFIS